LGPQIPPPQPPINCLIRKPSKRNRETARCPTPSTPAPSARSTRIGSSGCAISSKTNHIDWETYLRSLLADGRAPAPFIYGPDVYLDTADVSAFRDHLQAESLRRMAELMGRTEILAPESR
jgi:hypothetical protein